MFSVFFELCNETVSAQNLPDFAKLFPDNFTEAQGYMIENKHVIQFVCGKFSTEPFEVCAIVFPERLRYSALRNSAEMLSLEVLYVEYGADIDFSVGPFQMKPSFAERIEDYILQDSLLTYKYRILLPKSDDSYAERSKRIERLNELSAQVVYVCAMIDILKKRHNLKLISELERIRFLATAYNFNFLATEAEIINAEQFAFFPYGSKFKGKQYKYADVAEYYFRILQP